MKSYITVAVAATLFFSCKKEEAQTPLPSPEPVKTSEYSLLETGNYWVYQNYQIDLATGEKKKGNRTDSLYVGEDTLIGGKIYHQLKGTWFGIKFHRTIRLENQVLQDPFNNIYFTPQQDEYFFLRKDENPQNIFWDSIVWSMEHVNTTVETPIGSFNSEYQYNARYFFNPDIILDPTYSIRNDTEYYVKDVGVVRYTSSYTAPVDVHMDLIRYFVK